MSLLYSLILNGLEWSVLLRSLFFHLAIFKNIYKIKSDLLCQVVKRHVQTTILINSDLPQTIATKDTHLNLIN